MTIYKVFLAAIVSVLTTGCLVIANPLANKSSTQQIWVNHYRPFSPDSNKQELCLLIKDAGMSDTDPWEIYSGTIEGLDYEWGKLTKIEVTIHKDVNGQVAYRQVAILKQQQIAPGTVFSISVDPKGERDHAELIEVRSNNRFKIEGVPLFEASNSLLSERLLKMLDPEDSLRLDLMHTQESEVPLALTQAKVNGLPLPKPSHLYLVIGITIIAAIGLMRRPAKKTILTRHYRPRHA